MIDDREDMNRVSVEYVVIEMISEIEVICSPVADINTLMH